MSDLTGDELEPAPSKAMVTHDERLDRLAQIVSRRTLEGYSIVDRDERRVTAVLMKPGVPVNHVLHAIITLFSCGLWAIAWIILAANQKREERIRVSIDTTGNFVEERVSGPVAF